LGKARKRCGQIADQVGPRQSLHLDREQLRLLYRDPEISTRMPT
jgi:hypothetical protein